MAQQAVTSAADISPGRHLNSGHLADPL